VEGPEGHGLPPSRVTRPQSVREPQPDRRRVLGTGASPGTVTTALSRRTSPIRRSSAGSRATIGGRWLTTWCWRKIAAGTIGGTATCKTSEQASAIPHAWRQGRAPSCPARLTMLSSSIGRSHPGVEHPTTPRHRRWCASRSSPRGKVGFRAHPCQGSRDVGCRSGGSTWYCGLCQITVWIRSTPTRQRCRLCRKFMTRIR
jgi:hypothetical protein